MSTPLSRAQPYLYDPQTLLPITEGGIPSPVSGAGSALPTPGTWATMWKTDGNTDLGAYSVSGVLALTSSDVGSVIGGSTQAVLVANGVNVPTIDGVALSPYTNTSGALNLLVLTRVGNRVLWYCSQPSRSHGIGTTDYLRLATLTAVTESGDSLAGYTYASTGSGWATSSAIASRSIASGAAGEYRATLVQSQIIIGLSQNTPTGYTGMVGVIAVGIGSNYGNWQMGGTIAPVQQQAGDQIKCSRATDGTYSVSVVRSGGTELALISRSLPGQVWPACAFNGAGTSVGPLVAVSGL